MICCDCVIVCMGLNLLCSFVEVCGVIFISVEKEVFLVLLLVFEMSWLGIYVIGVLVGYLLIKYCMNQGYDVVEYFNGNIVLKLVDELILVVVFVLFFG